MRLLRTALILHRQALLLGIAVLVSLLLAERDAGAFHDERGGHIDQVAIDMGPPGVAVDVEGNGKPAVGDRDPDGAPDAEGFGAKVCGYFGLGADGVDDDGDTIADDGCPDAGVPASGTPEQGLCGNGVDDDPWVVRLTGVMTFDGVADDGCQVTLTPLEQCAEIIDDGVLNADEDFLAAGQDRLSIDITVGAQPGPGGGVPEDRMISNWKIFFKWDADVIDVDRLNRNFLLLASGGNIFGGDGGGEFDLPDTRSPFFATAFDHGPTESGPGVLARLTIEGNAAGVAHLTISPSIDDAGSIFITIDRIRSARVAVSKDMNGDTVISGPKEKFRCCPPGFVHSPRDSRKACGLRGP